MKKTSKSVATLASKVMRNPNSSDIQKSLAASALSQSNSKNITSERVESLASMALQSSKYNSTTKTLAGTVLSQSTKKAGER
jgi:hypothetical protein